MHLLQTVHPPSDLFERVYAAVIAGGEGVDFRDLRGRLDTVRANIATVQDRLGRRRWELLAIGIAGAIDALELGSPVRAREALGTGLRSFLLGRVAG